MRRFRAPTIGGEGGMRLGPEASHHLLRVTGIAPGERVELFDGQGARRTATFLRAEAGIACLRWDGPVEEEEALDERYLLLALCKPAAFDLAIRFATELGADHIWPILARRSVARGEREDRWERIAEAAVAQCGRSRAPRFRPPGLLGAALDALPPSVVGLIASPATRLLQPQPGPVALLVGPEGGWTEAELEEATARGVQAVGLGPNVLRVETAVAAGLARLRSG